MLKAIRPEYRRNRVKNTSGEGDKGISASNGSYAFDTTRAHSGRRCVKGTPSAGTVTLDYETDILPNSAQTFTAWCSGAEPTAFIVGATTVRPLRVQSSGVWHRYEVVFPAAACNGQTLVKVRSNAVIYVDDVQIEEGTTRSTHINGDLGFGHFWLGPANYSTSIRHRYWNGRLVFSGGVEYDIDDDERVRVSLLYGSGVPPVRFERMGRESGDGQITLDRSLEPRTLRYTFHLVEDDFEALRQLRSELIDLVAPRHQFRLIWDLDDITQYADVSYVSGLELGDVIIGYEKVAVTLQADESGWTASEQWAQALTLNETFTATHASHRLLGKWQNMDTGPGATTRRLVRAQDGTVYACTLSDGSYAYAGYWTGTTFVKLCRVSGNSIEVHDCKRSLDGTTLYVVGSFTTIAKPDGSGSTSAANIASINLATGAVAAIGAGLNGRGRRCWLSNDGAILYVTGDFTTAGGGSANRICQITLSGPTYAALGTGLDGVGRALCVLRDNRLVVGGDFIAAGGSTQVVAGLTATQISGGLGVGYTILNDIRGLNLVRTYVVVAYNGSNVAIARSAAYSPSRTWTGDRLTWTAYGGASTYKVFMQGKGYDWALLTTTASTTYDSTVNVFKTQWSSYTRATPETVTAANGSVQTPRIAVWDPVASAWAAYGQLGFSGPVYDLWLDPDGATLLASGQYGTADGDFANGVAWFNGYLWRGLGTGGDSSTAIIYAVRRFSDGSIWAVGTATTFGGDTLAVYIGRWIGSLHSGAWVHTDLVLPGGTTVYALTEALNGDPIIGHSANDSATRSSTTSIDWPGNMTGFVKLVVTGPGQVAYFGNYQLSAETYVNAYTVAAGEVLTFDMTPDAKTVVSSTLGNLSYIVRPGSEYGDVGLLPGDANTFSFLMTGTSGASDARLIGFPTYLSIDR